MNRAGGDVTFEEFLSAELGGLTRFAAVLTGDRYLAEDVVQDALIKAHDRWPHISGLDQPVAYLRRMIVNGYLSWRRRWATRTIQSAGDLTEHERPVVSADPAATVARADQVGRLIATLPRRQRVAIVLRFYAGYNDAEAAAVMECSVQTVRSHISRALTTLRMDPNLRESDESEEVQL